MSLSSFLLVAQNTAGALTEGANEIVNSPLAPSTPAVASTVTETNLAGGSMSADVIGMILNAGPMVKGVMLFLLIFSVVSWAIIIMKWIQLGRARSNSASFLDCFWKSRSLANLYAEAAGFGASPIAQIFRVGYQELGRVHKARVDQRTAMENVQRALRRSGAAESTSLSKNLAFLATCGNATPFIGLFGTVWGIMSSFHDIGLKGVANLTTVAPGISEALVATAAGLAAAIPAVIFFNHFNSKVRVLEAEMGNFMADFVNILERDLLKRVAGGGQPQNSQED